MSSLKQGADDENADPDYDQAPYGDADKEGIVKVISVPAGVIGRTKKAHLVDQVRKKCLARFRAPQHQFLQRFHEQWGVEYLAVDLSINAPFGIDHGGLNDVVKTVGRGEEDEAKFLGEGIDGVGAGAEQIPACVVDPLFPGEMAHRLRAVILGIEAQQGDREAVRTQGFPRLLHHLGEMPGGHGADVITTGINKAQYQGFALEIRKRKGAAPVIGQRVISRSGADGLLARLKGRLILELVDRILCRLGRHRRRWASKEDKGEQTREQGSDAGLVQRMDDVPDRQAR